MNDESEHGRRQQRDYLRAIDQTVVSIHVMHQKIAVIDERTVMLGSLNALSQSNTREVILTMRG
ncbi:phospholipase D-like domain-containing protein [Streptomyces liliiviolaceus]|uniref:phospholipase D-like domain-containing protein n=1 Tax=Streptomyces liliiviolaceus TaxID=2823109 RepID=UPI003899A5EA